MKRTKDGKIIASLTEVKNRTGDIFALVDEYGEVTLTSHSRPKYKIIKISLNEYISLDSIEEIDLSTSLSSETRIQNPPTIHEENKALNKLKTQMIKDENNKKPQTETQQNSQNNNTININIDPWNRNNVKEKRFIQKSIQPLI